MMDQLAAGARKIPRETWVFVVYSLTLKLKCGIIGLVIIKILIGGNSV